MLGSSPGPDLRKTLTGAVASAAVVVLVQLFTNSTPPVNDALYYLDMAEHGLAGNPHLAAPFAFRPAVPLIVHALARVSGIPPVEGFLMFARASAVALLFFTFLFARWLGAGTGASLLTMSAVGFSLFHVKFPLFLSSMVDIEATLILLLAMWALFARRFGWCLFLSAVGLFFKEFLAIPAVVMIGVLLVEFVTKKSRRSLFWILAIIATALACILIPRIFLPINPAYDFQEIHRFPPEVRLRMLLETPFDVLKDVNLLFSLLSYWLPTLILVTPSRARRAWDRLSGYRLPIILYLCLVVLMAMYGGTNLMIFVTYSIAAQIVVLTMFLESGISLPEIVLVVLGVAIFNKIPWEIPLPSSDFYGYIEFYGGWSSLVTPNTLLRFIEICALAGAGMVVRKVFRTRPLLGKTAG